MPLGNFETFSKIITEIPADATVAIIAIVTQACMYVEVSSVLFLYFVPHGMVLLASRGGPPVGSRKFRTSKFDQTRLDQPVLYGRFPPFTPPSKKGTPPQIRARQLPLGVPMCCLFVASKSKQASKQANLPLWSVGIFFQRWSFG